MPKKAISKRGNFGEFFLSILIYVVFHFHQKSDCYQKCLGLTSFYVNFYCTSFIWRHLGVKMNSKWLFNSTIVFPVLNIINLKYSHVQDDLPLVSMCSIWCHCEIRHFRYLLMSGYIISGYRVQRVWVFFAFLCWHCLAMALLSIFNLICSQKKVTCKSKTVLTVLVLNDYFCNHSVPVL